VSPPASKSPLRVLTLARDAGLGSGGAEVLAYEFTRRLDRERFKTYLCTTRRPAPSRTVRVAAERRELEEAGIGVLALDRDHSAQVAPFSRLYTTLVRERIDIVHAHMPRASLPGTILGRLARVPVVISHEHGSTLGGKWARRLVDRTVLARLSDALVVVSEWDRRQMIEVSGVPTERIVVLPNAIEAPEPSGENVRSTFNIPPANALIGLVGRLTSQKRQSDTIRAVGMLKAQGRAVSCVLLGEGPDLDELRSLVVGLGLEREVLLTGNRPDVPDVLAALDVAVLSSIWEGAPLALLEYMAAGAPIVATAVGAVPELIDDGVHGLLVGARDPAALAAAIARLLDDPPLARRLGGAARARQRAEFDLGVQIERLERLYVELFELSERAPHSDR
jgi:glycosyltransferase involved in cell wall biosynthesis